MGGLVGKVSPTAFTMGKPCQSLEMGFYLIHGY
jgi:hypothetical protein